MKKIIDKKAMGKRLASIRKELGITNEIAASYIGKEARTIIAYESGQNNVSLEYLHELCIRHKVSVDFILTGIGSKYLDKRDMQTKIDDLNAKYDNLINKLGI